MMLIVETRVHDEDRAIAFHKVVRVEGDGVDPSGYRMFENQMLHPFEKDAEMTRIA